MAAQMATLEADSPSAAGPEQRIFMLRLFRLFAGWLLVSAIVTAGFLGTASNAAYVLAVSAGMFFPLAAFFAAYRHSATFRTQVLSLDFSAITAIQFARLFAAAFLGLWAVGKIAPAFAIWTGGIDTFIGLTSMFAAYLLVTQRPFPRTALRCWNVLGLLSFVIGIPLAVLLTSSSLGVLNAHPTADEVFEFPLGLVTMGGAGLAMVLHVICLLQLRGPRAPESWPLFCRNTID
jgi:hypothetical protein